jgi:nucleoside-diphosphate-sugar epimerase
VGAHTYLGARVAAVFQERDYNVVCLAHENQETYALETIGAEVVRGSALEPEGWKNVLKRCDYALNLQDHFDLRAGPMPLVKAPRGREQEEELRQQKTLRAINLDAAVNFLDTCIAMDVPKILTLSSVFGIGDHRGAMADETTDHRRQFKSFYERMKHEALFQTKVRIEDGARVACVLPGPILGPRAEGPFGQIAQDYVTGRLAWGVEGRSQMTFTYIDDIVRGIFQILDRRAPEGLYIFGNEPMRWEEFFRKLGEVAHVTAARGWVKESVVEASVHGSHFWGRMRGREASFPKELLPYLADCHFRFSSARAQKEIGWDFTNPEVWMAEMVEEIRTAGQGPATQAAIETIKRSARPAGY